MNIPNIIYLYTDNKVVLDNDWLYIAPEECESFEYTQTDYFIEKACAWLEDNYPYYFETSIKEDFKNYMKENK